MRLIIGKVLISKIGVKIKLRVITKIHEDDSAIQFLTKSILCALVFPKNTRQLRRKTNFKSTNFFRIKYFEI